MLFEQNSKSINLFNSDYKRYNEYIKKGYLILKSYLILRIWVFCLCVCVHVDQVCVWHWGRKKALDTLELELGGV